MPFQARTHPDHCPCLASAPFRRAFARFIVAILTPEKTGEGFGVIFGCGHVRVVATPIEPHGAGTGIAVLERRPHRFGNRGIVAAGQQRHFDTLSYQGGCWRTGNGERVCREMPRTLCTHEFQESLPQLTVFYRATTTMSCARQLG